MGYTHYWRRQDHEQATTQVRRQSAEAYARLVIDTQRICKLAQKQGIALANGNGDEGTSPIFTEGYFALNGAGEDSYETFYWQAQPSVAEWQVDDVKKGSGVFNFCKTAYKPYDAVVTAILLRSKDHYGNLVKVSSDGVRSEWADGLELYEFAFGVPYTGAEVWR
jgi:hypothetical protein